MVFASRVPAVKLGLTSLDLLAIVKELQRALISARLENVYQLQNGSYLLKFRGKEGYSNLLVDLPRRLNLTNYKHAIPEKPTPQAAQLRRLLNGLRVEGVSQVDFDRIVRLDLFGGDEELHLYIELFGDGNIAVSDSKETIRYVLIRKEMKDRTLKVNHPYLPPPQRGADIRSDPPLDSIASQKVASVRALTRAFNIPPEMAQEGLLRSSIEATLPSDALTRSDLDRFLQNTRALIDEVVALRIQPNQVIRDGKPESFHPLVFRSVAGEKRSFPTFNESVDDYFSLVTTEESEARTKTPTEKAIGNLEAILKRQRGHIAELEERRKEAGDEGKLILSHLSEVQVAIDIVMRSRRAGEGWDSIEGQLARLGASEIDPANATLRILLDGKPACIDFRSSAASNAEKRFRESKDAAKKLEGLSSALRDTEFKLQQAREGLTRIPKQTALKAMKKEWYEKFRWFRSSEGLLVIGGRDSTQNEVLVKKHLGANDIFVHGDIPGGSVALIKSEGKTPSEISKAEAVSFAVSYSRAWGAGLAAADGYWVLPGQVSKTPPTGEYLGKGAFMIYGTKNFVRGARLQIHLWVEFADGAYRVRLAVSRGSVGESAPCVSVTPGSLEGRDLIRSVKELLAQRAGDLSAQVKAIPDQDIESLLPRGGCSVQ
jgi:predicted ribosome quality control (RQC) complex YloA/Tae2 family protein